MNYRQFLKSKSLVQIPTGISKGICLNELLFDFQRDITKWALNRGRAAIFADCGLGKTFMQLEWARNITGRVLILTPLAVAEQTIREAKKLDIHAVYARSQDESDNQIIVTNYEMLDKFDPEQFQGVVLDESSIIKHFEGSFRNQVIERFRKTPFRLACTATPAPNDHMELGNHAEFLGVMTRTEMLSMFFVHDGSDTSQWRLKGHAEKEFWRWVCSWAVMLRKPSDLGYQDKDFILPALEVKQETVESSAVAGDYLFPMEAQTLQERLQARKHSTMERANRCAEIVNASKKTWILWCNLNSEADVLESLIPDSVQVKGSDSLAVKTERLSQFSLGKIRVLISKPSICGFGMNWQHCSNVAFVGLSDSWEQYYQAVRRCWRFGQTNPVSVFIITSSQEGAVVANIKRKEFDADVMAREMINNMHTLNEQNIKGTVRKKDAFKRQIEKGESWEMRLGDCVEEVASLENDSIDFSVFSPPFDSLYTYSASERDIGNCKNASEFAEHFSFLVKELFRVIKPGRLVSFHCMNLPIAKSKQGYIGIRDFRGELIRQFQDAGFIYHSEVCIWKDPVTAMQRTKALGLLWKTIQKDSSMSRVGIPDYLVTMRKPGENAEFIAHSKEEFPVDQWQQWASPIWMDINPSDTLQFRSAREHKDERHICPLQLEVIRRALVLWSNRGDLVLSPFAGIASEGYEALKAERRFLGIELKESYFKQACGNLEAVTNEMKSELLIK